MRNFNYYGNPSSRKLSHIKYVFTTQHVFPTGNTTLQINNKHECKRLAIKTQTFSRPKSLVNGSCSSYCRTINTPIEKQHNKHRNEEGA